MNKIQTIQSIRAYENVLNASSSRNTQTGKGSNGGTSDKKQASGHEFRDILVKKLKSA